MEKYSSGRRGAPAKGIGRVTGARVQIPPSPFEVLNFEKIKNADERLFMTWIVDVLEKGKSDFVKEKLSILGEKYDAASAILYFKSQK